ncbi:MAG: hypothetical protein ACLVL7_00655 [Anaerotruncus massiliensis (ex Togo et al. 2019)]
MADLGEVGQKPPDLEPTEIPPTKPDIGRSADFSALSRVTGTELRRRPRRGDIGGSYRTVSAGAVVYAGTGSPRR